MNIANTTKQVIIDAIKERASSKGYRRNEVQLAICCNTNNELLLAWLRNGTGEAKTKVSNILGSYSLVPFLASKVENIIKKSLEKFSTQLQCSILTIQVRLYLLNDELTCDLIQNNEFNKKIKIEDIVGE